ncbi:MAG: AI-2E family transporter [Pseudomonadota bacterium]|nr:AI-2E family transporter [Pseudomonadota bacterium]
MAPTQTDASRALPLLVGTALVMGFLYWAKVIVVPVALALLFTFLLAPVSNWLERWRLGRVPAVVLVTVLAVAVVLAAIFGITRQIGTLLDDYPRYEQNITAKIAQYRARGRDGLLDKMQMVVERVSAQLERGQPLPETREQREAAQAQPVRIVSEGPFRLGQLWSVAGPLLQPVATFGLVLVLVMFMLLRREDLRDRVISLVGVRQLAETTRALEDAGERVSRYLLMQLLINVGYGAAVAIGLAVIGLPYAVLWGFFAALLRYIPYLGPWLAALLPIALALLISRDWTVVIMVVALFGVLELITNMFLEPVLYGRGIGVSQAALLVAVAFWTWLWGPVGLVLASPLTVCLVVLGRYVPFLKFLDTLLGDRPVLAPAQRFYQRLLAGDEDEASVLLERVTAESSRAAAMDAVVLPMLTQARADLRAGKIDVDDHAGIVQHTGAMVAELLEPPPAPAADNDAAPPPAPLQTARDDDSRTTVLALPARDGIDELAVTMLSRLLRTERFDYEAATSASLVSDVIARIEQSPPDVLFIASIPPGGLSHTRYLCKRLRARFPDLRIVVGRLGLYEDERAEQAGQLQEAGADRLVLGLAEAVSELGKLSMLD